MMINKLKDYPMDCDVCDSSIVMVGSWVSGGSGLTMSLWQCPECKSLQLMQSDEPLSLQNLCPRCGSENITKKSDDFSLCADCFLIFKELEAQKK